MQPAARRRAVGARMRAGQGNHWRDRRSSRPARRGRSGPDCPDRLKRLLPARRAPRSWTVHRSPSVSPGACSQASFGLWARWRQRTSSSSCPCRTAEVAVLDASPVLSAPTFREPPAVSWPQPTAPWRELAAHRGRARGGSGPMPSRSGASRGVRPGDLERSPATLRERLWHGHAGPTLFVTPRNAPGTPAGRPRDALAATVLTPISRS
jgi:hypothetical protein